MEKATEGDKKQNESEEQSLFVQAADSGEGYLDLEMSELLELAQSNENTDTTAGLSKQESFSQQEEDNNNAPILSELSQRQQMDTYRFFQRHPITLSTLLPFQKRIIVEMLKQDGILILARGLGMVKIASSLIHALDVAGSGLNDLDLSKPKDLRPETASNSLQSLVIVLGARERELETIKEELRELAIIDGMGTVFPDDESDEDTENGSEDMSAQPKKRQRGITILNTETASTIEKREKLYSKGGIFVVTSRIFIVDLLSHIIDPIKITGIVVMHADRVSPTSAESFILRIFRQKNKVGFIKALSEEPESFTGFSPLATIMKNLRVSKVFLWPRFHVNVSDSLSLRHLMYINTRTGQWKRPQTVDIKSVIEIEVELTESMKDIQTAVMECIEICVSEIKKSNPQIEVEFWNLDNAMSQNFDLVIRRQLDPIWHRISWRTKQMISDLTVLRQILTNITVYDCISFYKTLETILISNSPAPGSLKQTQSPWLYLDAADTLFSLARNRVFGPKLKKGEKQAHNHIIEEQPKWDQLGKILTEIGVEKSTGAHHTETQGSTLIMCRDRKTARQLSSFIRGMKEIESSGFKHYSGQKYLKNLLREYHEWKKGFSNVKRQLQNSKINQNSNTKKPETKIAKEETDQFKFGKPLNKRRRVRGASSVAANSEPHSSISSTGTASGGQFYNISEDADNADIAILEDQSIEIDVENGAGIEGDDIEIIGMQDSCYPLDPNNLVVIQTFEKQRDEDLLQELMPSFIIFYEPDATFIRQVEVYRSSNPYRQVRVYFMYYGLSVEEQRYLAAVRKEKDSFTRLIREKASLPITITNELDSEDPEAAFRRIAMSGSGKTNSATRIAGGQVIGRLPKEPPRIIVDHREFRSSLPGLIHAKFITVIPLMLTVGDYVLSPQICVERKSVPDLISSFKDGRLYTQCEAMFRYYDQPCLLIEFDENKSFSLEPFSDLPGGGYSSNISGGSGTVSGTIASTETAKMMQENIQSKLVILLLHFPKLKIIWSSSPQQTAEIFYDLKLGKNDNEPDVAVSAGFGINDNLIAESDRLYNHTAIDLLKAVPGVSPANYRKLINEYRSLQDIVKAKEEDLGKLIGNEAARKMYRFMNTNLRAD